MAGPVTTRATRKPYGDIVPPLFEVYFAKPNSDGQSWYDDQLQSYWEPTSMVESDSGDLSLLTLRYHLGAIPSTGTGQEFAEEVDTIQAGTKVWLRNAADGTDWFVGFVAQDEMLIQGNPQQEHLSIVAYGPEWFLDRNVVQGKWYAQADTDKKILTNTADTDSDLAVNNIELTFLPCVFNEDRKPNMGQEAWRLFDESSLSEDNGITGGAVFVPSERKTSNTTAQVWTAYRAIRSIIELFDRYQTISSAATDWLAIEAVLGDTVIGEVDVDGLPLSQALRAILGPLGFGWRLDVAGDNIDRFPFSVYSLKGRGKGKTPNLPKSGTGATELAGANGEVSRSDFVRDAHHIRNRVEVVGSRKLYLVNLQFAGDRTSDKIGRAHV